ncbi:MAG: hydrolase 1, exosortase A system-associated [Gammaproteobacteria bacterium]
MKFVQRALRFQCQGNCLLGIVDVPERPLPRGVLVLSCGQQYRVGAHRQFTLLARMLAPRGIPVMRFDCRGMGDSEGKPAPFDAQGDDLRAAIKEFFMQVPEMREVVLWGLDDAAAAATLFAPTEPRVRALILLNPWVRDPSLAPPPAKRSHAGEIGFWRRIGAAAHDRSVMDAQRSAPTVASPIQQRIMESLGRFDGRVLVILGGADRHTQHVTELLERHQRPAQRVVIDGADHTFASRAWRDQAAEASANWVMSW